MQIIWYNADLKEYKYGKKIAYQKEMTSSLNPSSYTLLMKLDSGSESLAHKIINQLNIASELPSKYSNRKLGLS